MDTKEIKIIPSEGYEIDKELLLKDLSARLPYGVICNTSEGDGHLGSIILTIFGIEYGINIKTTERNYFNDYFNDKEVCIKPYLRPMSSMTEEEKLMYEGLMIGTDNASYMSDVIDWLNKNMFDYRGLIPKDLAIEVTKENNPYKD